MPNRCRAKLLAALAAGLVLTACDDAPKEEAASSATANKPAAPKNDGLPPEMVSAVSAGSSASVISVHFALRDTPVVNKALPVDIAIVPHREFTSVRAHFEGHDSIAMPVGDAMEPVTSSKIEKVIKHQLVLLPSREGVFMVTATVETEGDDGTVTRVFSIPVIVAAQAPPAAAPPTNPAPAATN